jgi:LytS/YehU family sensor histidine kinase
LEEKKNAELAFLKAQMHPHFLFNTLNTLYSYAISNSPQSQTKSEQIVLQLSNLLRFILEECDKPLIVLKKEIKVIEDYIELQRLRHGDRINLVYKVDATNEEFVSPLLMLPIVENSFKHTLSSNRGKIEIQLSIKSEHGYVHLDLENDLIGQEKNVISFGKGLHSVRRQLELLYGTNFLLEIKMQTKSLSLV